MIFSFSIASQGQLKKKGKVDQSIVNHSIKLLQITGIIGKKVDIMKLTLLQCWGAGAREPGSGAGNKKIIGSRSRSWSQ